MDDTFIRQLFEFSKMPFAELKSAYRFSRNHVPKLALRASDYTIVFHTYWAPCPHNAGKNRINFTLQFPTRPDRPNQGFLRAYVRTNICAYHYCVSILLHTLPCDIRCFEMYNRP